MKKTKVIVRLVAECDIEMDIEHRDEDDPTDLTEDEKQAAEMQGSVAPKWRFDFAEIAKG